MPQDTLVMDDHTTGDRPNWSKKILGPQALLAEVDADSKPALKNTAFAATFGAKLDLAFEVNWGSDEISEPGWKLEVEHDISILKSEDISLFQTSKFVVGNSVYPFQHKFAFAIGNGCEVLLLYPLNQTSISGRGETVNRALNNFKSSFHVRFQQLLKLSTLSMSADELKEWEILSSLVDVEEHKRLTPIELRKIGTVVSLSPFLLQWLEADEPVPFDLAKAPAKLASFSIGDEFEAVVEFNRGTREITRILSVGCTPEAITSNGDPDETETIAPVDWSDL